MTISRVQDIVIQKMRRDPRIAPFMLDEILLHLRIGEPDVAKLLLRDLVHLQQDQAGQSQSAALRHHRGGRLEDRPYGGGGLWPGGFGGAQRPAPDLDGDRIARPDRGGGATAC